MFEALTPVVPEAQLHLSHKGYPVSFPLLSWQISTGFPTLVTLTNIFFTEQVFIKHLCYVSH